MSWKDDTLRQVLEAAGRNGQRPVAPTQAETLVLAAQAILTNRSAAESSFKARQRLDELSKLFTSPPALAIAERFRDSAS